MFCVDQIITKFGECVGQYSPGFIAVVFFFDLGFMLVNWGRSLRFAVAATNHSKLS